MALTGLHVEFRFFGKSLGPGGFDQIPAIPVYGPIHAAETMASAGTSSATSHDDPAGFGEQMLTIKSSADAWVTIGSLPEDPSLPMARRILVYAGVPLDQFCHPGDRVRWVLA